MFDWQKVIQYLLNFCFVLFQVVHWFFFGVVLLFFQILDAGVALLVWNYLAYFLGVFPILIGVCLFYVGGEI